MTTPDEWIDLIIRKASELRASGVRTLSIDGVSFTLDPAEPPPSRESRQEFDEHDVFNDPATYGRASGVPGFNRPRDE